MLLVRDLVKLAWFRGVDPFVRFLGPIALMQEAEHFAGRAKDTTMPLPVVDPRSLPRPGPLGALAVAMLPDPLADGTVQLVIGRDPACQLVLDSPWVSANHAAIQWDGTHGSVVDLASANGVFVNRKKIAASVTLASGDNVTFGKSTCLYLLSADLHARLRRFKPESER